MREDPDVILVGEMRDAETISMAMTAAETGHLVLGTLHTTGAVKTIDRVIDALPGDLREQTKAFLSMSLKAVVTQVLCKTPDGHGRRAVLEILVNNRAIAKLIAAGRVTRGSDPNDRRRAPLRPTAEGRAVYRGIVPLVKARERELTSALTPSEARALDRIIDKLHRRALDLRHDVSPTRDSRIGAASGN